MVMCLAVHIGAYVVERGDMFRNNDILKVQNNAMVQRAANSIHSQSMAEPQPTSTTPSPECALDPEVVAEIKGYQNVVDNIIDYVTAGAHKGQVYSHLADLVDTFGPRMVRHKKIKGWYMRMSVWRVVHLC